MRIEPLDLIIKYGNPYYFISNENEKMSLALQDGEIKLLKDLNDGTQLTVCKEKSISIIKVENMFWITWAGIMEGYNEN